MLALEQITEFLNKNLDAQECTGALMKEDKIIDDNAAYENMLAIIEQDDLLMYDLIADFLKNDNKVTRNKLLSHIKEMFIEFYKEQITQYYLQDYINDNEFKIRQDKQNGELFLDK